MEYTFNIWSIFTASIVAFVIGSIWYSPFLFGQEWLELANLGEKNIFNAKKMWRKYTFQLLSTAVMFIILAFIISTLKTISGTDGAFVGFLIWLGFILTESVGMLLWERKPLKLIMIESICTLLSLVVGGAIIGGWA